MKKILLVICFLFISISVFAMQININKASVKELIKINGIGQKKAEAIVKYRKQHGKFNKIEDLIKVKGISNKLLSKIKPQVCIKCK